MVTTAEEKAEAGSVNMFVTFVDATHPVDPKKVIISALLVQAIVPGSRPDSSFLHLEGGRQYHVRGTSDQCEAIINAKFVELFQMWWMMRQMKSEHEKWRRSVVDSCMGSIDKAMNKAINAMVAPAVSAYLDHVAGDTLAEEDGTSKPKPDKGRVKGKQLAAAAG